MAVFQTCKRWIKMRLIVPEVIEDRFLLPEEKVSGKNEYRRTNEFHEVMNKR